MQKLRNIFPNYIHSLLNSYTQIFFSNNILFACLLIIVTFLDVYAGLSGVIAVTVSNTFAYVIGFNRNNIKAGYYGFNSLLVGLGLGVSYQPNAEFYIILIFAALLTLFVTVMLEGVIGKYGLPFLSISFLIVFWMVTLATREFTALKISERGIYTYNEMYSIGGMAMVKVYKWFNELELHEAVIIYFRSLGAILFQYHLFAGLVISIGLIIYSRIAFILSVVGFASAYFFYKLIGANINELSYGYIGFNYILTSIAIGGFFIVASKYSYLWVLLLTPLISITITSTSVLFSILQLSIFSLPFNFIVILFLYVLKFRERFYDKPEIVGIQHYTPEENLYLQKNNVSRFKNSYLLPFSLPFWGEWKVTQGHDGKFTHKGEWRHAWDFELVSDDAIPFKENGYNVDDYYCYSKPVTAPLAGWIESVVDFVDDNKIGDVNTHSNWGNTIIIRHTAYLFTKLCHLKKESIKVKVGDYVNKGDVIASCGNSGRSPQPHIHFQFQATPYIGSKTLDYPFGNYILNDNGVYQLKSFVNPKEGQSILNIEKNSSLFKAYHFIPGKRIQYVVTNETTGKQKLFEWEVVTDYYNQSYLYCKTTDSKAYFTNDGTIHYFTHFEGSKKSLLYYFYLANYKVINGFYKNLTIEDKYPLTTVGNKLLLLIQDLIAPFYIFMKADYSLTYIKKSDDFSDEDIELKASTVIKIGRFKVNQIDFKIFIEKNLIKKLSIEHDGIKSEAIMVTDDDE